MKHLILALAFWAGASAAQTELRFNEFYRLPIGPRGLEPSAKLLSLDGQSVRLVGYRVPLAEAPPGLIILAPLPVSLGDEDESFADDLPASAVYVHLPESSAAALPPSGLLRVSGRLQLGPQREADGRFSFVRLILEKIDVTPR
jgi:hypothetical protein